MSAAMFPWVPDWLRILLTLAMLAVGLIVAFAAARAALYLLCVAGEAAWEGAQRLALWLSNLLIQFALGVVAVMGTALLVGARALWWGVRYLAARALAPLAVWFEALRQRARLRQLWGEEYRDQFPRFEDFLYAFERGGKPREEERQEPRFDNGPKAQKKREPHRPSPPPDPKRLAYIAALKVLGFADDSALTPIVLERRYRLRIKTAHPDKGGSHQQAAALNSARDLIKSMKGWA